MTSPSYSCALCRSTTGCFIRGSAPTPCTTPTGSTRTTSAGTTHPEDTITKVRQQEQTAGSRQTTNSQQQFWWFYILDIYACAFLGCGIFGTVFYFKHVFYLDNEEEGTRSEEKKKIRWQGMRNISRARVHSTEMDTGQHSFNIFLYLPF